MLFSSFIHGIAPLIAAFVPIIPFLIFEGTFAMILAIGITFALLFIIGAYLGTLTKERVIISGIRLLLVGMGTAAICYLLGAVH
ncbi:MAG: VIT1/CCC1 transporter family protein [Thermoplasmata archaeon]